MENQMSLLIRAYNLSQLAVLYKVSRPTMRKWIQPISKKLGVISTRLYTTRQVRIILKHLGYPEIRIILPKQ
ncbi:MAG: hypothetical protein ABIS36_23255 [Chryseolinea sp.]